MKNNIMKCVDMVVLVVLCVCVLSATIESRANSDGKMVFNEISSDNTIMQKTDDHIHVAAHQRILQAALTIMQLIIIGVVFVLVLQIVITICFRMIAKHNSKKEISENFTKEQKEKAETKSNIYTNDIIIIIIIVVLLFVGAVIHSIKRSKPIVYNYPEEGGTSISTTVSDTERKTSAIDTTGTARKYQRILGAAITITQLIILGIAFILVVRLFFIICFRIIAKHKSKKEINESFSKEQKEEAEKKCEIYRGKIIRSIIIIILLLSVAIAIEIIRHPRTLTTYTDPEDGSKYYVSLQSK